MKTQSVIDHCKLPGKSVYKWPKLEELYRILFKKEMSDKFDAHDALGDIQATCNCFVKLMAKNLIQIPETVKQ